MVHEIDRSFGGRIKALRKARKLTLEEAGKALKINPVQLSNYENGHRNLSAAKLKEFSKFYEVSTDFLLGLGSNSNDSDKDPADEVAFQNIVKAIYKLSGSLFKIVVRHISEFVSLYNTSETPDGKLILNDTPLKKKNTRQ